MILKKGITLLLLLTTLTVHVYAQSDQSGFDISKAPQWVQDLRRWEIVTFGSFPFAMFTATFAMDTYRWANPGDGRPFSDARYAPWPFKSAGAIAMERHEQELTITIAASLSVAIAIADFIIVKVKRDKARKRAEALPSGTLIITRESLSQEPPEPPPDEIPHAGDIDEFTGGEPVPVP